MTSPHCHELALPAPAKLNLALAVHPPEPPGSERPGWHRIASWMHPIELRGTVHLSRSTVSSLSRAWAPGTPWISALDWPVQKDLAWRARVLMEDHVGRALPTAISLTKRVPVGGGLGGGSSEAASVLVGLNILHGLGLDQPTLARLSTRLGSDVAFFLDQTESGWCRPAYINRFGDGVKRIRRQIAGVVLIVPPFGCSTPAVYRHFDAHLPQAFREHEVETMSEAPPMPDRLFNDLTQPACRVEPRLEGLMQAARKASGREVHLTGSGSTLFLLCEEGEQERIAERLAQPCRPAWVHATRLC